MLGVHFSCSFCYCPNGGAYTLPLYQDPLKFKKSNVYKELSMCERYQMLLHKQECYIHPPQDPECWVQIHLVYLLHNPSWYVWFLFLLCSLWHLWFTQTSNSRKERTAEGIPRASTPPSLLGGTDAPHAGDNLLSEPGTRTILFTCVPSLTSTRAETQSTPNVYVKIKQRPVKSAFGL